MTFGEKVRELRNMKDLSQADLGKAVGVTLRTVRNWEVEGRYPKDRDIYTKLAEVLGCNINYLMTEDAEFMTEAEEVYGYRGRKSAEKLLAEINGLFAGGTLAEEDMAEFTMAVQEAFFEAKKKNKKKYGKKNNKEKGGD